MIKPRLHHVTIKTSHLDEMIAWYSLVLGVQVQFRDQVAAWTTNDEANHRIAFLAVPGLSDDAKKVNHNGMHHCAFEFASFDDLMASFDRLRKAGMEPAFCLDHGLTISLYYKDPEGNFVELQSDNFGGLEDFNRILCVLTGFCCQSHRDFLRSGRVYNENKSGGGFQDIAKSHPRRRLSCLIRSPLSVCRHHSV